MQGDSQVQAAPLYGQIATRIRHLIAQGELSEGDPLPSLREGSRRWGVNLHTVRRAYEALAADGLVVTEPRRGTRIAGAATPPAEGEDALEDFVEWVSRTAQLRFGMEADELAQRLAWAPSPRQSPVWVLECSSSMAAGLAREIGAWSDREIRPCLLHDAARLPAGPVLATYYHYAEVRELTRWRADPVCFFGVRIDGAHLAKIAAAAEPTGRLLLLAPAALTGEAMAADLGDALAGVGSCSRVELVLTSDPRNELERVPLELPVVLSPENWDRCDSQIERDNVFPIVFQPLPRDLARIGRTLGWPRTEAAAT